MEPVDFYKDLSIFIEIDNFCWKMSIFDELHRLLMKCVDFFDEIRRLAHSIGTFCRFCRLSDSGPFLLIFVDFRQFSSILGQLLKILVNFASTSSLSGLSQNLGKYTTV